MSTALNVDLFTGASWPGCQAFIRNIRSVAWEEGRLRDGGWMADTASMFFADEALRWHSKLPLDVRQDWFRLEAALVDEWYSPSDGQKNELDNVPVAPAARLMKSKETRNQLDCGILKAIVEGSDTQFYVQRKDDGNFIITVDSAHAARFRFEPEASLKLLEYVDGRCYSWLAIHWRHEAYDVGRGSVSWSDLSVVDSETMKSSRSNPGPFQLATCRVSQSGEVTFLWRNGNTETSLAVFNCGSGLFPVPDPDAYQKNSPTEKRVRVFIQRM